jgi:hypothetical protein
VLEAEHEVRNHVVSSLDPTEIGIIFPRRYRLDGDRLTLTTLDRKGKAPGTYSRLLWTRVTDTSGPMAG